MSDTGKIFINFSDKDRAKAVQLCEVLESSGFKCWISCRDIPAGANYKEKIIEALSTSRLMILLISETSCNSKYVIREVELAFDNDVSIIPIRIDDVKPAGMLKYSIATVNWINAFEKPLGEYYPLIISAVKGFNRIENDEEKESPFQNRVPSVPLSSKKEPPEWMNTVKKTLFSQALYVFAHPVKYLKSYPGDLPHVLIFTFLVIMLMVVEVFQLRFAFPDKGVAENTVIFNMTLSIIIVPLCLLVCFLLSYIFLPFKKRISWIISIFLLLFAFSLVYLLIYQICYKGTLDFSKYTEWPVPLIIGKDCWTYFVFAIGFATNTWNHVHALRGQAVEPMGKMIGTNNKKNRENSILPTIIIPVPLIPYILVVSFWVVVLFVWDFITQANFKDTFPGTSHFVTFGTVRNTVGVFIGFEVFTWYYYQLKRI